MSAGRVTPHAWKGIEAVPVLVEAGVELDPDGLIRIPYRNRDGSTFRERIIAPSGRRWWGPGDELVPLGLETLDREAGEAIVAEGESDTFALRYAYPEAVVLGIPGTSCWRPEWAGYLEGFERVYLIADGDTAGRELGRRFLRDFQSARVVRLPDGADARGLLLAEGWRTLDRFLDDADERAELVSDFLGSRNLDAFLQRRRSRALHAEHLRTRETARAEFLRGLEEAPA